MNEVKLIKETEILGKKIKMYGSINQPLFMATDVAEWINYSKSNGKYKVSQMLKPIDIELKGIYLVATLGGIQEKYFINEDGLYDVCMLSNKEGAKELRKEIKAYLKQIRLTGAAIEQGKEQDMVNHYFSQFSDEIKLSMIKELEEKNKEFKQFYDDLLNTQGLMDMNTVAKELGIGEYGLFAYLRGKKILFYNSDNINIPFERFRKEGKFFVKKVLCRDGKYRDATLATNKGLEYIRKQMRKDGLMEVSANA
jgi:prophage antirepressor-like protein